MAIDYLLAVKCEPQQVLGAEKLVELHRTRVLARSALLHMREDGDQREPREIEIQLTMRNPEGDSARGVTLEKLSLGEMQTIEPRIDAEVFDVLGVTRSVNSRTSYGGTAPANVRRQARRWLTRLKAATK